MDTSSQAIAADIRRQGFAFVPADHMKTLMSSRALKGWAGYAESWNNLGPDLHMGDGGRYRRRLHAAFAVTAQDIARKPHQPHYQSLSHNTLNGGVDRWFDPVTEAVGGGDTNMTLIDVCRSVFTKAAEVQKPADYHAEMHQFRIEPTPNSLGKPTPEGVHRDGVDWVCVMLVNRVNVSEGITSIFSAEKRANLGNFTLTEPMDCVFMDDHRVLHGVSPVTLGNPEQKGYRDVLVLTFKGGPQI